MTSYSMERKGTEYIVHLPLLTSVTYERPVENPSLMHLMTGDRYMSLGNLWNYVL